ncbi:MAG: translation initiation factor IF-2 subunit alpha, partial [Thermoplasmata archaeon]|nr:translation initiation factor IF-2 subunit alpha [Thermoplasmata archaeon]
KEGGKVAWVTAFLKIAQENIVPPHIAIRGTLEITDSSPAGVENVRKALEVAEAVDAEAVTVVYVGAPRYRIQVAGTQYKQAEETMKHATEAAIASIKGAGGEGSFARA